jgi:hypothetical protein
MLGMLMLPKTICYILLITVFLRSVAGNVPRTIKMKEENR